MCICAFIYWISGDFSLKLLEYADEFVTQYY